MLIIGTDSKPYYRARLKPQLTPWRGTMEPVPYDPIKLERILSRSGYAIVQPKLNGNHASWDGEKLHSSNGNEITTLPHVVEEARARLGKMPAEGEAYCHGMSQHEINGLINRSEYHPRAAAISLHVFDLPSPLMLARRLPWMLRRENSQAVKFVQWHHAHSPAEVAEQLARQLDQGYEGVVIKDPAGLWSPGKQDSIMKMKPPFDDTYTVRRCLPGRGKLAGTLGALEMEDSRGHIFKVGNFGQDRHWRDHIWRNRGELKGAAARVTYQAMSAKGAPLGAVVVSIEERGKA